MEEDRVNRRLMGDNTLTEKSRWETRISHSSFKSLPQTDREPFLHYAVCETKKVCVCVCVCVCKRGSIMWAFLLHWNT